MHTRMRLKFFDPLELETRHLDHRDVPLDANRIDQRRAEIAAHECTASRRLQNLAEQHDHRALAVGAGDRGYWHFEETTRELDLSDYRDSFLNGGPQQKRIARYSWTSNDQLDSVQPARIFGTELQFAGRQ